MKKIKLLLSCIALVLLFGCQAQSYDPIDITANTDVCYTCHMGIEDVAFASQAILEDGTPRVFDDIGCLVNYLASTSDSVKVAYVHDTNSGDWIDYSTSTFVQNSSFHSPMSYGIAAFQTEADAAAYQAVHGGHVYSSQELLTLDIKSLKAIGGHGH